MNSGEWFNKLLSSLEAIKELGLKTTISDFDSAIIDTIKQMKAFVHVMDVVNKYFKE